MESLKSRGASRQSREKGIEPPDQQPIRVCDSTGFRVPPAIASGLRFGCSPIAIAATSVIVSQLV
jgi:hypothetical protein